MSLRFIQLGSALCDQGKLILSLFNNAVEFYRKDQRYDTLMIDANS